MSGLSDFLTQSTAPWWAASGAAVVGAGIALISTALSDGRKKRLELDRRREEHARRWDTTIQPAITRFLLSIAAQVDAYKTASAYITRTYGEAAFSDHRIRDALLQGQWRVLSPVHAHRLNVRGKKLLEGAHAEDAHATAALVEVQVVASMDIVTRAQDLVNAAFAYTQSLFHKQESNSLHVRYVVERSDLIEAARAAFEVNPLLTKKHWLRWESSTPPSAL